MKQEAVVETIQENPEDIVGIELIENTRKLIQENSSKFLFIAKQLRIIRGKKYYRLIKDTRTSDYFSSFEEFCELYYGLPKTTVFYYMQALGYLEKYHPEIVHTCELIEYRKINRLASLDNEEFEDKRKELDKKVFNGEISFRDLDEEIRSLKEKSIDIDLRKVQSYDGNMFYLGDSYEEYEDKQILCIEKHNDKIISYDEYYPTVTPQSVFFKNSGREFSLREYASVQGFPNDFKFVGTDSEIKKQIGNASEVKIAQYIINKHIKGKIYMDLLCGCGGFSYGAKLNNKECAYAIDKDKFARYSFQLNFPDTLMGINDIKKVNADLLKESLRKIDFILAGLPCQGLPDARDKSDFEIDEGNSLYLELIRFLKIFKPSQFIMENVPSILEYKDRIIKDFNEAGYEIKVEEVNGLDIGSNQNRTSIFFIGNIEEGKEKTCEKIDLENLNRINESYQDQTKKVMRKTLIGEKSQLEYLGKRNKNYDKKYGMFYNLFIELDIEKVLELFGGVGIQTYYLENYKKISNHTIVERNQECFNILKSMFPKKEIILSDNRNLRYEEKYDLVILDSGMNASNFDDTIKLLKDINSKYFIITETGAFRVKFNKNLSHEAHYQNLIKKLNFVGYKVEKVLYEYNYGLILINNEFTGVPLINKNTFSNQEWRDYLKKMKK